jgi:zinc/manganese transport system ATP-binding protein/zinc transport system ATP-binding protein
LKIAVGEFIGLVGPSGSGKTTLLRTLVGTVQPVQGQVRVDSKPVQGGRLPRVVGYVPQLEMVDWTFPVTVEQVVMMGRIREMSLVPWASRKDKMLVQETLSRLGLGELSKRHIRALSGGQQQRVFLARALISNPKILLLDEPTSGVDIKTRNDILNLLAEINQSGVTIVLTTHDLNSVAAHLPKVVCINRQLVAEGKPEEIFTEEVLAATYGTGMRVVRQDGMLLIGDDPQLFKNLKQPPAGNEMTAKVNLNSSADAGWDTNAEGKATIEVKK